MPSVSRSNPGSISSRNFEEVRMKKYALYVDFDKEKFAGKGPEAVVFESVTVVVPEAPDAFKASEVALTAIGGALPGLKIKNFQVYER
jgi:hypothetical protein